MLESYNIYIVHVYIHSMCIIYYIYTFVILLVVYKLQYK